MSFPIPNAQKSFASLEEEILQFWDKNQIFEQSIETRHVENEYVFYDGPPFATGLPHYGHLLASTIKDVIPRYWTMKGYRVERRFGWDCHGLPIENIVEKELGSTSKKDIEDKIGIDTFNEACRSKVDLYVEEWEKVVHRLGRWTDFENDYKTMDLDFMESVMWAFATLHKKDLIYEGRRISLYCSRCATPLSNFEIAMDNSYQIKHDQTATVKFRLKQTSSQTAAPSPLLGGTKGGLGHHQDNISILAWTTTPWTLPSNFALAVNPELEYCTVEHEGEKLIVTKNLVEKIFGEDTQIVATFLGKELEGLEYEPLFPYFKDQTELFRVVGADFVSDEDGTGIVHLAPFGEDDFNYAQTHKLPIQELETVDEGGIFTEEVTDFVGMSVIDPQTNKQINLVLEERGQLFHAQQHSHSYPHCYRCETPLIYKPQRAYFLAVHKIKDQMLKNNQEIYWSPGHLKDGRFGKGLETAPDWNLSRNRFWGSPIPIWKCDSCDAETVVESVEELEQLSGEKVADLHKHFVDKLSWKCEKCASGRMNRTPEVLDCWFESGSMPYAQKHYPFEHVDQFERTFPGDFIAEYIAQTRGWFYTLHVLSTALFGSHSFKNAICTGTILAEDGTKMSKSKKNYPDPTLIFDKYGADAMRFYLMGSSVMKGENFNFAEKGVEEVLKSVILPLQNAYNFFATYANIDGWNPTKFVFVRHGEGDHNILNIYSSSPDVRHHLTSKGKDQVTATAKNLEKFEHLFASPFVRTQETAQIIKDTAQFEGEIQIDDRVREVGVHETLEGEALIGPKARYQDDKNESLQAIYTRLKSFIDEKTESHPRSTICVASHGDPIKMTRAINAGAPSDITLEEYLRFPKNHTASANRIFPDPKAKNDLDKWILSELQSTIKTFRYHFEAYETEQALRVIPQFIDHLNNWYLRRSRRRFWEGKPGEFSNDKQSAYETLHHVLITMSKVIAPICPFFAEKLFQDLGGGASVHLSVFPFARTHWIDKNAETQTHLAREITRLSGAIRARKKIKLRQPLSVLQFATSTDIKDLEPLLPIIAEEANVKKVEVLQKLDGIAQQIIKVDARKVGPRLGKKVQELIKAGKEGNFTPLENGEVEIAGEILKPEEYENAFLCEEGLEAEATSSVVVLLNTEVSEDLKIEGNAREIIRAIQDLRKKEGFEVSDRIIITYETESETLKKALDQFSEKISEETLAASIQTGEGIKALEIEDEKMKISLQKA